MGCGPSNSKPGLEPLAKNSNLGFAQTMKITPSGHEINPKVISKIMTQREADKLLNDVETPHDFKIIFGPPFNEFNRIMGFLYVTGLGGLVKENIEVMEIKMIINATYEWPLLNIPGIMSFRVPVDDGVEDDISIYFNEVADKIEECRISGNRVLVHCMAGVSRSTALVLAYLMKYQNINLKNAFKSVKKRRETARPNIGFWEQLIRYEIRRRGVASVRMSKMTQLGLTVTVPDIYTTEHMSLFMVEIAKQIAIGTSRLTDPESKIKSKKQFNHTSLTYE